LAITCCIQRAWSGEISLSDRHAALLGPQDCCASAAGRERDRISTNPPLDSRASRHPGQAADGSAKRVSRQGDG
jgi:hypothetical protein